MREAWHHSRCFGTESCRVMSLLNYARMGRLVPKPPPLWAGVTDLGEPQSVSVLKVIPERSRGACYALKLISHFLRDTLRSPEDAVQSLHRGTQPHGEFPLRQSKAFHCLAHRLSRCDSVIGINGYFRTFMASLSVFACVIDGKIKIFVTKNLRNIARNDFPLTHDTETEAGTEFRQGCLHWQAPPVSGAACPPSAPKTPPSYFQRNA